MLLQDGNWTIPDGEWVYPYNIENWIVPFLEFGILIVLLVGLVYCYRYMRIWILILTIYLFSIVIGLVSILSWSIPLTPWVQIFFLIFQSILFISTTMEVYKYK